MSPMPRHKTRSPQTLRSGTGVKDARLVEEARRGDREAFGELVLRYERRLIRVILRFVRDEELAKEPQEYRDYWAAWTDIKKTFLAVVPAKTPGPDNKIKVTGQQWVPLPKHEDKNRK